MIAGAPGAWGSLVIFSSSCEMGWKPSEDRKSTRLNSSHLVISYAVFCLKKKKPVQPVIPVRRANEDTPRLVRGTARHIRPPSQPPVVRVPRHLAAATHHTHAVKTSMRA